jgi:cytosine deaminase
MLSRDAALAALSRGSEGSVLLRRVRVPRACLSDEALRAAADAEGVVTCDVGISRGLVSVARLAAPPGSGSDAEAGHDATLDARGAMLWPAFVDAHTHLCKTHAVPRCRNPSGSINDALACEVTDQPRWSSPDVGAGRDIERRMDFALRSCLHHGTRAVRTHLDGVNAEDEALRSLVYAAFDAARAKYAPLGIALQGVANLYLPLYAALPEMAARHADDAAKHEGVVLGAYCGDVSASPPGETARAFDALFALAEALERARARGYAGLVTLGHVTSLSLQPPETQRGVIARLAALAPLVVVCNPFTNLGLQDRRGTDPPVGVAIDRAAPRTPLWRGLTLLQELRAAGVTVAAASDNVRDWWHPYGDYDCLAVWREAVLAGHLDTAPSEGDWADAVCGAAACAMGLSGAERGVIEVGAMADLVLFPNARRCSELLARPHGDRVAIRGGDAVDHPLPTFDELDDLVEGLELEVDTEQDVLRGATRRPLKSSDE